MLVPVSGFVDYESSLVASNIAAVDIVFELHETL